MHGFSDGKVLKKGLSAVSRMILVTIIAGIVALTGLSFQALVATSAAAAGGADVFVIGAATGTAAVVVRSSPGTYYSIEVASGTIGAAVKCWNRTTFAGVDFGDEANLLDDVVITTASALGVGQPVANFRDGQSRTNKNASVGITCKKSAAGDVVLVNSTQ